MKTSYIITEGLTISYKFYKFHNLNRLKIMNLLNCRLLAIATAGLTFCTPVASADVIVSSDPVGYYRVPLVEGFQTIGVTLIHSPVFVTALASSDSDSVSATESVNDIGALLAGGKEYYLEVVCGPTDKTEPYVGHRFEVDESATINAGTPDGDVVLVPSASINTATTIPDLTGYRVEIRPHVTLTEAFVKEPLYAAFDLGLADQVQIYNGSSFTAYYLLGSNGEGDLKIWGTFNFQSVDNLIVPPGTGLLYKRSSQAPANVDLVISGKVRANPFYQLLEPGFNFVSEAYPIPSSFTMRDAFPDEFDASFDIGLADQVQVYDGSGFTTYFLAGGASTIKIWLLTGDFVTNRNDDEIFDFRRSVFVKKSNAATNYRIPLGWTP